jgi:uncharacterized protein YfbU (UPF0304 family)
VTIASAVKVLASNFPFAELKTNDCPFETLDTSTFVNVPNEMLEDGATLTELEVLFAGFTDTVVAALLTMVTIVAIIV